jgi:hypothetical protein
MTNLMKISGLGAEFFRAKGEIDKQSDREMDRHDKANSRFSQFCEKRLKNRERVRSAENLC